jgi:hypothetical protein
LVPTKISEEVEIAGETQQLQSNGKAVSFKDRNQENTQDSATEWRHPAGPRSPENGSGESTNP